MAKETKEETTNNLSKIIPFAFPQARRQASLKAASNLEDAELKDKASPEVVPEQPEIKLSEIALSDQNQVVFLLANFRKRNKGAKDFDDFARGIDTELTSTDLESIKHFYELHLKPIAEACEDYILKAAEKIRDLIEKALLLCRLEVCKAAAMKVAELALKMIEQTFQNLGREMPVDKLFTPKCFAEANA